MTIRGAGFAKPKADACSSAFGGVCDSGYLCKWGPCECALHTDCSPAICDSVTNATWDAERGELVCSSPIWHELGPAPAQVEVQVSLNGQDFSPGLHFATYLDLPEGFALKQMFPVMGPATGGTLLRICLLYTSPSPRDS